ncbi:Choline transporter protein 2, partial [Paragonimus heterotremus]
HDENDCFKNIFTICSFWCLFLPFLDVTKAAHAGPVDKRSCTDIPCCLLFFLFIVGFLIVTLWSFAMGDYRRVLYPTNSQGQVCGKDIPDKPYLYFFDLARCLTFAPAAMIVGCPTPQVCVKSCPDYYWSWKSPYSSSDPRPSRELMICLEGKNATAPEFVNLSIDELVRTRKCAPYTFNSKPVFGRCMPSQLTRLLANGTGQVYDQTGKRVDLANDQNESVSGVSVVKGRNLVMQLTSVFEKIVADLNKSWPTIVVCLAITIVLSFVWVVMLRCCAGVMVWTTLILFVLLFTASTIFCFCRWHHLRNRAEEIPYELSFDISVYFQSATMWLVFGIISVILLVVLVLVLIFLRNRIRIAIAIINETSRALARMTSVLFWPLLPLVLELLVIAQVVFVAICLRSIADPVGLQQTNLTFIPTSQDKARQDLKDMFHLIPCDPTGNSSAGKACRFLYYGDRKYTIFLQFFNLFMFFWLVNFVRSLAEMTLAGAFAHYYFSRHDSKAMPKCPLLQSFFRAAFYHIGSLAFGSLLLALLQWVRVLLEYIDAKLKKYENGCTRCLVRGCCCFLWCLEKFLRFLNRNAFIMIAIYGQSFCSGARAAFELLAKNIVRVVVVDKVTDFLLFVGKMLVVLISGSLSYLYLSGVIFADTALAEFQPTLHYLFIPVLIVVVGSYIIVSVFSSVYEMGVDTIFLCFRTCIIE